MARPRKHAHARYQPLKWNHGEYVSDLLPGDPKEVFHPTIITRWRRQAGRLTNSARGTLIRPQPARDTDPMTIMLVLDGLLRTNPDAYINAGNLTQHFVDARQYPQVIWNHIVVGRLLSCFHDVAAEIPAPNGGAPMISRVRYGSQKNYIIQPDIHTWHWLGCLRDHFGQLNAATIRRELDEQQPIELTYDEVWSGWHFDIGDAPEKAA